MAVLALATVPAFAQSTDGNSSASAPSGGNRSSTAWSPSAMGRAALAPRPNVNPDDVRSAGRARAAIPDKPGTTPSADLAGDAGTKERSAGNVVEKPLYWAGKLFFREPDGDYVCSGQFISPKVVLTAAHCVRSDETGEWYKDFIFALQYNNGDYGAIYSYDCVATRNAWVQPGFEKYLSDYAMIRVDNPSKTGKLRHRIGAGAASIQRGQQDRLSRRRRGRRGDPGRARPDRLRRRRRPDEARQPGRPGRLERRRLDRRVLGSSKATTTATT